MKVLKNCVYLIAGLALLVSGASADRVEHVEEVLSEAGIQELEIQIDFAAGSIDVTSKDMDEAARLDIYYSPRYVDYDVDLKVRNGRCV